MAWEGVGLGEDTQSSISKKSVLKKINDIYFSGQFKFEKFRANCGGVLFVSTSPI
jgi:hypothetical protein